MGEPKKYISEEGNSKVEGAVRNTSEFNAFLKGYRPKDDHFTTNEEIELVARKLSLEDQDVETLRNTRNRVVRYYSSLMDREIQYNPDGSFAGRSDKYWDYNYGMMSVTAIIDRYMYRRNPASMR